MRGNAPIQAAVLNAIQDGECVRMDELAARVDHPRRALSIAAAGLIERGLAERREIGCFRLTEAGKRAKAEGIVLRSGPRGPVVRNKPLGTSLRARLWRAMRIKQKFTIPALLEIADTGDKAAVSNAQHYIRGLVAAGYLQRLTRREAGASPTSNGYPRYMLILNTGEQPPIIRRDRKTLYDPNTQETVPCKHG